VALQSRWMWVDGRPASAPRLVPPGAPVAVHEDVPLRATPQGTAMIRVQPRLERLAARAAAAGLELAAVIELDRLHEVVAEVIAANGAGDGIARVSAWMDEEDMTGEPLHVAVTIRPAPHVGATGLRLASLLNAPAAGPVAGRFASRHQARRRGADGAVVVSSVGNVLYCTEGALFVVADRTIIMPESSGSMPDLPVFQQLLSEIGYPLHTVVMTRDMLRKANDVFVVDAALSVLDVVAIDNRPVTSGRDVATALRRALDRVFESDDLRSRLWLEHVGKREPLPWPNPSDIDVFDLGYGHGV
jgi:branched-subunit amino acid aminotransferase/4-amino-4-deoxychorismate lyase